MQKRTFFWKPILSTALALLLVLALAGTALAGPNPVVRLDTSLGAIRLELYPEQAPVTVDNFLYYVSAGFYDGEDENGPTIFHRVDDDFVIQGGGFTPEFYEVGASARKLTRPAIPNEADNGLANDAYTVAMARTSDPNSATSQFFINAVDNLFLNHTAPTQGGWGYAVFGKVIEGTGVVDAINAVPTAEEVPVDPVVINRAVIEDLGDGLDLSSRLYYPHVASNENWETEIAVVNSDPELSIIGVLVGYTGNGTPVPGSVNFKLPPLGRRQFTVGTFFANPSDIRYFVLQADRETAYGYTKFTREGRYRAAVPATADVASGDLFISHIASSPPWWTGIGLVNTTGVEKTIELAFDNGDIATRTLGPGGHAAFSIRSLFGGNARQDIHSAVIRNAEGLVGLELFGSTDTSGQNYLGGLLLKDFAEPNLFYPHIAENEVWWTGIVAYNPGTEACDLTVRPYSANGTALNLNASAIQLAPGEKYVGTAEALGLPADAAWLSLSAKTAGAETDHPIVGFELFGARDGSRLGGFSVLDLPTTDGILPRLRSGGWTGVSLVNTAFSRAAVGLLAIDNLGMVRAQENLEINSRSKVLGIAENLFTEDSSAGTYIRYISDKPVAAFQLNKGASDALLDGLPGLGLN
ncbi:MAG: peptidylprolyl isomerase [Desulfococcaceae bacterium]